LWSGHERDFRIDLACADFKRARFIDQIANLAQKALMLGGSDGAPAISQAKGVNLGLKPIAHMQQRQVFRGEIDQYGLKSRPECLGRNRQTAQDLLLDKVPEVWINRQPVCAVHDLMIPNSAEDALIA
jgi:hypothetical protein